MGDIGLKIFLWVMPWLILFSGVYYGLNECKKDFNFFITGNLPEISENFFKKFSSDVANEDFKDIKVRNIRIENCDELCNAIAEIEFKSSFPYAIKLKKFEVIIINQNQANQNIFQRLYLEKPIIIRPNKTVVLELKGHVSSTFDENQNYITKTNVEFEVFGVTFEMVMGGDNEQ